MKTEIKLTFDETEKQERNIIMLSSALYMECIEFQNKLRHRYKYGEFESHDTLNLLEEIIQDFHQSIGTVTSQIEE